MLKQIWEQLYALCIEGFPAKKICVILKRDRAQISRMINAFVDAGFLYCINPGDKVKFYEATSKVFTGEQEIVDQLNQQINPKILQRQARHKSIETTLRYDHSTDEIVKDYYNKKQGKFNNEFNHRGDEVGYS